MTLDLPQLAAPLRGRMAEHPRTVEGVKAVATGVATVVTVAAVVAAAPVTGGGSVVAAVAMMGAAGGAAATAAYTAGAISGETKTTSEAGERVQTLSNPAALVTAAANKGDMKWANRVAAATDILTGVHDAVAPAEGAGKLLSGAVHASGASTAASGAQSMKETFKKKSAEDKD